MRRYSFTYFLGQSFKGLWRNGVMSIASVTVLMSCLIVMGSFSLLVYNINYNVERIATLNEIKLFVDADAQTVDETPEADAVTASSLGIDTTELRQKIETLEAFSSLEETTAQRSEIEQAIAALREAGVTYDEVIVAYQKVAARIDGLQTVYGKLIALDNVAAVSLVSKQAALEQEKERYADYADLFESLSENPYPDSFVLQYTDNSSVSNLEYQLNHLDERIYKVSSDTSVAETIESLKSVVIMVFSWFLVILFVVSIFVIINTIKLAVFSRRQEISIMRYVGATNFFITIPFLFEGVIIGLLASGIAYFGQYYIYTYIVRMMQDVPFLSVVPFSEMSLFVAVAFAGVGILTGIIGSSFSLRRYMKA